MMVSSLMQRPLKTIARTSGDVYIPRGVSVPALDKDVLWEFQPKKLGNPIKVTIFFMYLKVVLQTLKPFFYNEALLNFTELFLNSWSFFLLNAGEGDLLTGGDLYAVSLLLFKHEASLYKAL